MRIVVTAIILASLTAGCATHTQHPITSRSAPPEMIQAARESHPDATLEHVFHFKRTNPLATTYDYWEAILMVNDQVVADVWHGLRRTVITPRTE